MHKNQFSFIILSASSSIHQFIVTFQLPELQGDGRNYHQSGKVETSIVRAFTTGIYQALPCGLKQVSHRILKGTQNPTAALHRQEFNFFQCDKSCRNHADMMKFGYSVCARSVCVCVCPSVCERERVQ